jgi:hypothetical protein
MTCKRAAHFAYSFAPIGVVVAACSSEPPPAAPNWKIDCVSVLGIPTPSGQTPVVAIQPPAGVPRSARFADLTDAELGRFSDWEACMSGGYGHGCCSDTQCSQGYTSANPPGPFRLETASLLASAVTTCYTLGGEDGILASRESVMALYRNTVLSNCHVGTYEDCQVETIPGFQGGSAPDCAELNALCSD